MKAPQVLLALLLAGGCIDTGQDSVRVPLLVAGTSTGTFLGAGGAEVTLDRADVAFGPLYLCAGSTAGDLCETARLEWLDTVVVDTLDPSPASAGELTGVSGPVQSWMYDLGISSQLTRSRPFVLEAAASLGDASVVVEGRATVAGVPRTFSVAVPIQQSSDTELGVPVIRKSNSETFFRDVTGNESGLTVRFDPKIWAQDIDFQSLADRAPCDTDGCPPLSIEPESQAYRTIQLAVMSGTRPSFEWNATP